LRNTDIEHELLCEINLINSIVNKCLWQNLETAVGLLLLATDFDTYTKTTLSSYSNDQICWWVWKH